MFITARFKNAERNTISEYNFALPHLAVKPTLRARIRAKKTLPCSLSGQTRGNAQNAI